jgi:hypothetical protein
MPNKVDKWNYAIPLGHQNEWWRYFGEYLWLVDMVFAKADQGEVSVISRPVLFLMRHTLELGYKGNIVELEKISGLDSVLQFKGRKAHNLEKLHQDFERHFRAISKQFNIDADVVAQFDGLNSTLTKLNNALHRLDTDSYAFRYPFKTDGRTPSFQQSESIHIAEMKETFKAAITLLKYTTDVIAEYLPPSSNE